jgi:HAD superfamily hydrolase (TIGR01549 family)
MSRGASPFRGVVFDLDGTLLDSMPFVFHGLATAVSPYRPRPTTEEVMGSLGGPSDACLRRLLGGRKHLAEALTMYLGYLRENEGRLRPFRGARRLLNDLQAASVRLGIWTGRERDSSVARLRALSWQRCFAPIVCGDDLPSHKPDPEGLLKILRSWRLTPREALFVGDSDQDLEGGRAAGVPMVAIGHGRRIGAGLLRHPLAVAPNPPAAYALVRELVLPGQE